ncbi:MAG: hypothetical protein ACI9DJ_003494, partial [Algoriphagus sp.]
MEDILKKLSLFSIIFTSILIFLFFLIDLGIFGDEVRITGLYYVFMAGFLGSAIWIYKNRGRFN